MTSLQHFDGASQARLLTPSPLQQLPCDYGISNITDFQQFLLQSLQSQTSLESSPYDASTGNPTTDILAHFSPTGFSDLVFGRSTGIVDSSSQHVHTASSPLAITVRTSQMKSITPIDVSYSATRVPHNHPIFDGTASPSEFGVYHDTRTGVPTAPICDVGPHCDLHPPPHIVSGSGFQSRLPTSFSDVVDTDGNCTVVPNVLSSPTAVPFDDFHAYLPSIKAVELHVEADWGGKIVPYLLSSPVVVSPESFGTEIAAALPVIGPFSYAHAPATKAASYLGYGITVAWLTAAVFSFFLALLYAALPLDSPAAAVVSPFVGMQISLN